jgi:hypothetical protein
MNNLRNLKSITNRFTLKMNSEYSSMHTVLSTSSDLFGLSGFAGGLSGRVRRLSV